VPPPAVGDGPSLTSECGGTMAVESRGAATREIAEANAAIRL
jgi:hypothetical protein